MTYLEVKDNGPGIHPITLAETLTSIGVNHFLDMKGDYAFQEHGINMKISFLRLAQQAIIITKTQPELKFGILEQYLSVALFSTKFCKDQQNPYLLCPFVTMEMKNRKIYQYKTNGGDEFLDLIASYSKGLFENGDDIKCYGLNKIPDSGTHLILLDLKKVQTQTGMQDELIV